MSATALFITLFIWLGTDIYAYQAFRTLSRDWRTSMKWTFRSLYWASSLFVLIVFIQTLPEFENSRNLNPQIYFFIGCLITFTLPKMVLMSVLLIEDIARFFRAVFVAGKKTVKKQEANDIELFQSRRKFISTTGLVLASVPFAGLMDGLTRGQYNFTLHEHTLWFDDLPEAFDGLKVVQISDLHSGGFDSEEGLRKGIDLIKEQHADVILFTGDLVNNLAEEMDPWKHMFQELEASMGMYASLGNHDYGHYIEWNSHEEAEANIAAIQKHITDIGFRLLNNENQILRRNDQELAIIGVENWGSPPFPQYGDLDKGLQGVPDDAFSILLSHDPSHFDAIVVDHPKHIHLTLSGHTHGMQFGVEVPGIKWSPVELRYPKWAGLYEEQSQYLYVNRGFGCIAFPGRVGIWPEVTSFTLRKGQRPLIS